MNLFSRLCLIVCVLFTTAAKSAEPRDAPIDALQSWIVFEKGQDVVVLLSYSGGIESWDAAIRYDDGLLFTTNSGFVTITGPGGKRLIPKKDKRISRQINAYAKEPFDTRINLSAIYNLLTPGRYTVEWGCEKVRSQKIRIEIVEKIFEN